MTRRGDRIVTVNPRQEATYVLLVALPILKLVENIERAREIGKRHVVDRPQVHLLNVRHERDLHRPGRFHGGFWFLPLPPPPGVPPLFFSFGPVGVVLFAATAACPCLFLFDFGATRGARSAAVAPPFLSSSPPWGGRSLPPPPPP